MFKITLQKPQKDITKLVLNETFVEIKKGTKINMALEYFGDVEGYGSLFI